MYDLLAWLEQNVKQVIIVVVALGVALLAMFVSKENTRQAELDASAALMKLDLGIGAAATNAAPASEIMAVHEQHHGTSAGAASLLLAARAHFKEGDYDAAKSAFDHFLGEQSDSPFAAGAAYGAAACLEAKGQLEEAKSAYEAVAGRYQGDPVSVQARFAVARMLQAQGMAREAALAFDELASNTTSTYWAGQARTRREQIYKENPDLRPAEAELADGNS